MFKCPICGNEDQKYVGLKNCQPYCRRCISFRNDTELSMVRYPKNAPIIISYELSKEQKELSDKLLSNYKQGTNSLVNAVCGSGKTEIVLQVVSYAIKSGEAVGFAVPRRDVAIELADRFRSIFKYNKIVCVYGGHHDVLKGDLVILTTHQLYRYKEYFNLLILDEIDAFPFKDNPTLNSFFHLAIKGNYILLSATPDDETIAYFSKPGFSILSLNKRFHNFPLPIPQIRLYKKYLLLYGLYKNLTRLLKETKPVFVFTPTIDICESTFKFVSLFLKNGSFVNSKRDKRQHVIDDFRKGKYQFLITTAILERGVTVKDLQVIVFCADNAIYDKASLIQISGRAGRKKDAPNGEVIYIAQRITKAMEESIDAIEQHNSDL